MRLQEGFNIEKLVFGIPKDATQSHERFIQQAQTINSVRSTIAETVNNAMDKIRQVQGPPTVFTQRFEADLNKILIPHGSDFQIKFYSAVHTELDYGAGFDGWIELQNRRSGERLSDFKIDISINGQKIQAHGSADMMFYFDDNEFVDRNSSGDRIKDNFFQSKEYQFLLKTAEASLRAKFPYAHKLKQFEKDQGNADSSTSRRRIIAPSRSSNEPNSQIQGMA